MDGTSPKSGEGEPNSIKLPQLSHHSNNVMPVHVMRRLSELDQYTYQYAVYAREFRGIEAVLERDGYSDVVVLPWIPRACQRVDRFPARYAR